MNDEPLKVINVKYAETRRGIAYQCETNHKGVEIWNKGDGSITRVEVGNELSPSYDTDSPYHYLTSQDLEKLIDEFENNNI